jgi:hypothetical protein
MADKMKIPAQRAHKESKGEHGSGRRATHPVVGEEKLYNFPADHYKTEENRKKYRKQVGTKPVVINRRGLSELDKILISNGGLAHPILRGRGSRFVTPMKKRRRD